MIETFPLVAIYLVGVVTGAYVTHGLHLAWCRAAALVSPPGRPVDECRTCRGDGWVETVFGSDVMCMDCDGIGRSSRGGGGRT